MKSMKNNRGFIAPLLIAIIAILLAGGYVYTQNQQPAQPVNSGAQAISTTTPVPASSSSKTSHGDLVIASDSEVQFLVTDPQGRRSGFDPKTGKILSEILGASYGGQRVIENWDYQNSKPIDPNKSTDGYSVDYRFEYEQQPLNGTYVVTFFGSATNSYHQYFYSYDQNQHLSKVVRDASSTQKLKVQYSDDLGSEIQVTII
ncbi:hypothetical protein A2678_00750 [Candidatus Kaiserbacteria bacterium RIFCSPHIGHO2_01_FULL_53_31]|uniref:Uncharacterized protein n=1 Tax=Candidatus Kaiserbacteria bacterium RIFCSPHIGHO2_01_FULL_53_31 TaxID=1798481 RepID=A0A1F6CIR9_9BACT|nr:MAG: hypothetical protein A2678_00750 [Candidatus Kaiserbacteria bacterium RIFCSPHIGHO2_01_FULL_53_31]